MLRLILALLFPVALLGGAASIVWFVFIAGWNTAAHWLQHKVEELP